MRKWLRSSVLLLLGVGCVALAAVAQPPQTPAPREITVKVQTFLEPVQPVQGVQVRLTHLDNSQPAVDAQGPTSPRGEALLLISEYAAERSDLRIVISGASDLAIYQPADGELVTGLGPAVNKITIDLLKKGSPLLGGKQQIKAFLTRVAKPPQQMPSLQRQNAEVTQENAALKQQNSSLQSQLTAAQESAQAQQQETAAQIAAWAEANGFTPDEGNAMVKQWALDNKDDEAALSAFVLKDYPEAARLFQSEAGSARELRAKVMQTVQSALERNRELLRTELQSSEGSARSFQLASQYHAATQALEAVRNDAAQAHQEALEDESIRGIWLEAARGAADARLLESDFAPPDQSLSLLAQSADDLALLAREYAARQDRSYESAMTDVNLSDVLAAEAERATGEKAAALFDQAVQTLQDAISTNGGIFSITASQIGFHLRIAAIDIAAGRYGACLEQTRPISSAWLPPDVASIHDAIELACEWGAGDKKSALLTDQSLQARLRSAGGMGQPTFRWDYDPLTFFVENSPTFTPGRASWIALLAAVRNHDSAGITAALHQLEPILQQ